jgi:hypothetical protein
MCLMLENLALRQQLAVLKRKHPKARLGPFDKLFWVVARRFWSKWKDALLLVSPETVVRWHRGWIPIVLGHALQSAKASGREENFQTNP